MTAMYILPCVCRDVGHVLLLTGGEHFVPSSSEKDLAIFIEGWFLMVLYLLLLTLIARGFMHFSPGATKQAWDSH